MSVTCCEVVICLIPKFVQLETFELVILLLKRFPPGFGSVESGAGGPAYFCFGKMSLSGIDETLRMLGVAVDTTPTTPAKAKTSDAAADLLSSPIASWMLSSSPSAAASLVSPLSGNV